MTSATEQYNRSGNSRSLRVTRLRRTGIYGRRDSVPYEINSHHQRWAGNAKQRYGRTQAYYLELICKQEGRCALSNVTLLFSATDGTPVKGGLGCHPLYAALDHCAPGCDAQGHQILCYALNDLKGHLPHDCFVSLIETVAWQRLMTAWREQANLDAMDRKRFYALLRPSANQV